MQTTLRERERDAFYIKEKERDMQTTIRERKREM